MCSIGRVARVAILLLAFVGLLPNAQGCGCEPRSTQDAGAQDAGPTDAAPTVDASVPDASVPDSGAPDAAPLDASAPDSAVGAVVDIDFPVRLAGLPLQHRMGADLNGDGLLDGYRLGIEFPTQECVLRVAFAVAPGRYAASLELDRWTGECPQQLFALEWNGDSRVDVAVAAGQTTCRVYLGSSQGPRAPAQVVEHPCAMMVEDLNRDGQADVIEWAPINYHPAGVLLSQPDHQRMHVAFNPGAGAMETRFVAAAHLDNGTVAALVLVRGIFDPATVWIARWDGAAFTEEPTAFTVAAQAPLRVAAVADFTGDGLQDVVVAQDVQGADDPLRVFVATPGGNLAPALITTVKTPTGFVAADVDGDNLLDLVVSSAASDYGNDNNLEVLWGDGSGAFPARTTLFHSGTPVTGVWDANGDGLLDLVVGGNAAYLGRGQRGFRAARAHAVNVVGRNTGRMTDVNGDGIKDLLMDTQVGLTAVELLGNGDIAAVTPCPPVPPYIANVLVDQDGDGALDRFFLTDTMAYFQAGLGGCSLGDPEPIQWGMPLLEDVNLDGMLDALTLSYPSLMGECRLATGRGTFGPPSPMPAAFSSYDLRTLDFNGDGALDLLIPQVSNFGQWFQPYVVWWGDGACNFTMGPSLEWSPGEPLGFAILDLDGSGRAQLVVSLDSDEFVITSWEEGTLRHQRMTSPHPGSIGTYVNLSGSGRPTILAGNGELGWLMEWNGLAFETLLEIPMGAVGLPVDLEGDGDWDMVYCGYGWAGAQVGVAFNHGAP